MYAAELAQRLKAIRSGRQWKCRCVAHEDGSPSMIIFDGNDRVQVRCLAGCEPIEIISELKRRGLWDQALHYTAPQPTPAKVSHETVMCDRARRLFDEAMLCRGTWAQSYFETREIWTVACGIDDIKFSHNCPREQERRPAIVVAMRDIHDGQIVAVQRIYLKRDGERIVKDGKPMMMGSAGRAAMMLYPWSARGRVLHISEGLESGLSVMAMDHELVWAMGSCGAIERLPVLFDRVRRLTIWADNDPPGIKAAEACADRWYAAGLQVKIKIPDREGWDPADVWISRNGRE
jgi:putative DNA primase/helicase